MKEIMGNTVMEIIFGILALLVFLSGIIVVSKLDVSAIKLKRYIFVVMISVITGVIFYQYLEFPLIIIVLLALGMGMISFFYLSRRSRKKSDK